MRARSAKAEELSLTLQAMGIGVAESMGGTAARATAAAGRCGAAGSGCVRLLSDV